MKYALLFFFVCSPLFAADQPCVILKRASTGEHVWSGIEYQYVRGEYPKGFSFRTNLHGRHMRKLQAMGAKFVILETVYTPEQLDEAQKQCGLAGPSAPPAPTSGSTAK
jgi:hypothetical protein